ncbi:MAG: hypothetical protein J6Y53_00670 [Alphaproteobacteria bacterium]|nr:hypothetical protein [Alphaproteobacteria bacterium]
MKKKILVGAIVLAIWDLFYIFVLANSFVTESLEDKFFYWGYPQWGSLYSSPSFFMWFNIVYLLLLAGGMFLAWKWRSNYEKMLLPLVFIALLSFVNMYSPNHIRNSEFDKYKTEDGVDNSRIPAGKWLVSNQKMESYAEVPLMMKLKGWFGRGEWPGNVSTWGEYRVWLVPGPDTSMEGRRGFVLHGGNKTGSPWGVNMGKDIVQFAEQLKNIPNPLELNVEY